MTNPSTSPSWLTSVRGQLYTALIALTLCLVILSGWSISQLLSQRPVLASAVNLTTRVADKDIQLIRLTDGIRLDVVQVQQWLTDISATRALDGLNDGLDEADKYANKTRQDVATATAIAEDLGLSEITEALAAVGAAFKPYYSVGKGMAQAYIDGGPASGNKMMAGFDAQAEALSESIQALTKLIEDHSAKDLAAMRKQSAEILSSNKHMVNAMIVPTIIAFIIAAFGIVVVARTVKNLSSITESVENIADGDLETPVAVRNLQNEIGRIGSAIDDFRLRLITAREMEAQQHETERQIGRAHV